MPEPESLLQALATLPLCGQLEGALDEFVQALILCPTTASSEARCSLQKGGSRPGSWGPQAPVRSHLPPFPPTTPSWTWPLPERDFAPRPALVSGAKRHSRVTACASLRPRHGFRVCLLTWGLRWARLQVAGLSANRLHQRVTAPDDVGALVALHVAHPHAHPTRLGALSGEKRCDHSPWWGGGPARGAVGLSSSCQVAESPWTRDTQMLRGSGNQMLLPPPPCCILLSFPVRAWTPHLSPEAGPLVPALQCPVLREAQDTGGHSPGRDWLPAPVKSWGPIDYIFQSQHPHPRLPVQMFPSENPAKLPRTPGPSADPSYPAVLPLRS